METKINNGRDSIVVSGHLGENMISGDSNSIISINIYMLDSSNSIELMENIKKTLEEEYIKKRNQNKAT